MIFLLDMQNERQTVSKACIVFWIMSMYVRLYFAEAQRHVFFSSVSQPDREIYMYTDDIGHYSKKLKCVKCVQCDLKMGIFKVSRIYSK